MNRVVTFVIAATIILAANSYLQAETLRFAVLGDTRGSKDHIINEEVFPTIVERVSQADPPVQFVIVTGDLVRGMTYNDTMLEAFARWRQIAEPWYNSQMMGLKVYPVPGNHDLVNVLTYVGVWQKAFPELPDNGPENNKKLYYSFDLGPCHFVGISTSAPYTGHRTDLDWLAKDLAASTAPIKIVIGHEPAYPVESHLCTSLDYYGDLRDEFWQILVENSVTVYFCGHEHRYHHLVKDGVHQIITGGGGAPSPFFHYLLVDIDDENNINVAVYDLEGELYEQYSISEPASDSADIIIPTDCTGSPLPCNLVLIALSAGMIVGYQLLQPRRGN